VIRKSISLLLRKLHRDDDSNIFIQFQIAMGQGQMEVALDLLKKCSSQGSWLCLKNLHLVTPWLTTLEKVTILFYNKDFVAGNHQNLFRIVFNLKHQFLKRFFYNC
jgi:hypothetical protein